MSEGNLGAFSHISLTPHDSEHINKARKGGHRKSIMQANIAESIKLRQARAKAIRDVQRGRIDGRHKYMFNLLGNYFKLDAAAVEEFMLDGDQVSFA